MLKKLTVVTTSKGKDMMEDINNYRYTFNSAGTKNDRWRCAVRTCNARIRTCKTTKLLVEDELPEHNHANSLIKNHIKEHEQKLIRQYANVQDATHKTALKEITKSFQQSNTPSFICGMSSKDSIKKAFWREKKKSNPTPALPKMGDYQSFMNGSLPPNFTQTNDGAEFLALQSWTNNAEQEALLVFLSDTGAQVCINFKKCISFIEGFPKRRNQ